MKALLIGDRPPRDLGHDYVNTPPYDGVVIGSLTVSQLLHFSHEEALEELCQGKPVWVYAPGLPDAPKNRALAASLASAKRQLKNWGMLFVDGSQKRLITAQEARILKASGSLPPPGSVLTPLAKEIMEGST